jgi:probable rRNA maturation factor
MEPRRQEHQICVQVTVDCDDTEVDLSAFKEIAEAVCRRFDLSEAIVGVAIVDDDEFRRLNRQFRHSDTISDCLSFDLSDESQADSPRAFELVLNTQQAAREASSRGHSVSAELALYLVHGLLHNLGFDDATESQAGKMHEAEDEILQELGYGSVYNAKVKISEHQGRKPQK